MNTSSDLKQSGIDAFFSKFNFFLKIFYLAKMIIVYQGNVQNAQKIITVQVKKYCSGYNCVSPNTNECKFDSECSGFIYK